MRRCVAMRGVSTRSVRARWLAGLGLGLGVMLGAQPALAADAPVTVFGDPVAPGDCVPAPTAPTAEQAAQGMARAVDRGFLFKLERDGRTSWLFGTIHAARAEWIYPGPRLVEALKSADVMALEVDPLDTQVTTEAQQAMRAEPSDAPLPPTLAARVHALAMALCVGDALQAVKPEMQVMVLGISAARRKGLEPAYGIDRLLAGMAQAVGMPRHSLERPGEQIQLLLGEQPAERDEQIAHALQEITSARGGRTLQRMADAWGGSDWADMSAYLDWCGCVETDVDRKLMRRMLDDRNLTMAAGVDALHANGKQVLAAVGTLHLVGAQGLPALMAARGYRVTRVVPPSP